MRRPVRSPEPVYRHGAPPRAGTDAAMPNQNWRRDVLGDQSRNNKFQECEAVACRVTATKGSEEEVPLSQAPLEAASTGLGSSSSLAVPRGMIDTQPLLCTASEVLCRGRPPLAAIAGALQAPAHRPRLAARYGHAHSAEQGQMHVRDSRIRVQVKMEGLKAGGEFQNSRLYVREKAK